MNKNSYRNSLPTNGIALVVMFDSEPLEHAIDVLVEQVSAYVSREDLVINQAGTDEEPVFTLYLTKKLSNEQKYLLGVVANAAIASRRLLRKTGLS